MEFPLKFYRRYGIRPTDYHSIEEANHATLREIFAREAAQGSVAAEFAQKSLGSLSGGEVEKLLEPKVYEVCPRAFDPPKRNRQPELPLEIYDAVVKNVGVTKNESEAVRKAYSLSSMFRRRYKNEKQLGTRWRQIKMQVHEIRETWNIKWPGKLWNLIHDYKHDRGAMHIVWKLWYYGRLLEDATARGDEVSIATAECELDSIWDSEPVGFVFRLAALIGDSAEFFVLRASRLIERLKDAQQRRELLAGTHGEQLSERELVDAAVKMFEEIGIRLK